MAFTNQFEMSSTLLGTTGASRGLRRLVNDDPVGEHNPKYRFPGDREKVGTRIQFRKSELLYHPDELRGVKCKYLFLVEGFASVWWFWQHGIRPVAAVMGASISARQVELVCELTSENARIVLIPDGDEAGERLARSALELLAPHRFVRWLRLSDDKQPTDWNGEELRQAYVIN